MAFPFIGQGVGSIQVQNAFISHQGLFIAVKLVECISPTLIRADQALIATQCLIVGPQGFIVTFQPVKSVATATICLCLFRVKLKRTLKRDQAFPIILKL